MRGSIVKRKSGTWAVVIPLGRDPRTGKKRQLWRSYRTRREAEAQLGRLLAQVQAGDLVPSTRVRTGEFLEQWLRDDIAGRVAPTTQAIYAYAVRRHAAPALGHIPLLRLSAPAVQAFLNAILSHGLAAGTVHQVYRTLNTALNTAVEWGLLPRNPCKYVKPPRAGQRQRSIWDEEQTHLFLAEARRSSPHYQLYLTMVLTGLRPGEVLALRWGDVSLPIGEITVRQKFYRLGRQQIWGETKTHKQHSVAIPPVLVEELRRLHEEQRERKALLRDEYEDQKLVFCQANGRPLHQHNLSQRDFRTITKRAGLPRMRLYDLRHGNATYLANQGTPVHVTQPRLGHSSPSTTLRYYIHELRGQQQEAVGRLAERLLGEQPDSGISRD